MKKLIPTALTILIAFVILYILKENYSKENDTTLIKTSQTADSSTITQIGQVVPDFQFTTLNGKEMHINDLYGKVVLLNFFATWCQPCMAEMPHLEKEIWQKHQSDDFVLVTLGREHTKAELDSFNLEKGFTFPIVPDTGRIIFSKFATQNIPRNVLIDKTGKIVYQAIGFEEKEFTKLKNKIEELLKK